MCMPIYAKYWYLWPLLSHITHWLYNAYFELFLKMLPPPKKISIEIFCLGIFWNIFRLCTTFWYLYDIPSNTVDVCVSRFLMRNFGGPWEHKLTTDSVPWRLQIVVDHLIMENIKSIPISIHHRLWYMKNKNLL